MCLIEGTNLSEGRGTCTPFELVGAPYIKDPEDFKKRIDDFNFAGVITRPCFFRPKFQKHADKDCGGIFIHVTDRSQFLPVRFGVAVIAAARAYDGFDWRRDPYEFENDRLAIDLLLGDNRLKDLLETNKPFNEIMDVFLEEERAFSAIRNSYLHYLKFRL